MNKSPLIPRLYLGLSILLLTMTFSPFLLLMTIDSFPINDLVAVAIKLTIGGIMLLGPVALILGFFLKRKYANDVESIKKIKWGMYINIIPFIYSILLYADVFLLSSLN